MDLSFVLYYLCGSIISEICKPIYWIFSSNTMTHYSRILVFSNLVSGVNVIALDLFIAGDLAVLASIIEIY